MSYVNTAKTIPEIFSDVRKLSTVEEKANYLRKYRSKGLQYFVKSLYDPLWSDAVIPNFKPSTFPAGNNHTTIAGAIRRLDIIRDIAKTWPERSQSLFELVLESVSADEAVLLTHFVTKKKIDGISKAVFKRVYPELFENDSSSDIEE